MVSSLAVRRQQWSFRVVPHGRYAAVHPVELVLKVNKLAFIDINPVGRGCVSEVDSNSPHAAGSVMWAFDYYSRDHGLSVGAINAPDLL